MVQIRIQIIFEGHFIRTFEYLNICAHHCTIVTPRYKYDCIAVSKTIFQYQYQISRYRAPTDFFQPEYTQIRIFTYFPFDHFPKFKICSESRFEMIRSIFLF